MKSADLLGESTEPHGNVHQLLPLLFVEQQLQDPQHKARHKPNVTHAGIVQWGLKPETGPALLLCDVTSPRLKQISQLTVLAICLQDHTES